MSAQDDHFLSLWRNDPDVRLMVNAVCAAEGVQTLWQLRSTNRAVYDDLYESVLDMINQLGEHQP